MENEVMEVVENNEEAIVEVAKTFKEIWKESPIAVKLVAFVAGIAVPVIGYFMVKAVRCLKQKLKEKKAETEKVTETVEPVIEDEEPVEETEE